MTTFTASAASADPQQGLQLPFGSASIEPVAGAVRRLLAVDGRQSPGGCDCGCGCSKDAAGARGLPSDNLGFVYNSKTVNVKPVIISTLATDASGALPSQIYATLTMDGVTQKGTNLQLSSGSPGSSFVIPIQATTTVTSSGLHTWQLDLTAVSGSTIDYTKTVTGTLPLLVNDSSSCGAGWNVAGVQSLLTNSNVSGIGLMDYATAGYRLFQGSPGSPPFTFTSPANDQGTLTWNADHSYTYTSKDQYKTNFDSTGKLSTVVDPHGLTTSFAFSGSNLSTVTQPDGGVLSFTYSSSNVVVQAPGSRTCTLTLDINNNLTGYTDASGAVHTFAYNSPRLSNEQVGTENTTYSYDGNGLLNQINRGAGTTLAVTPVAAQGITGSSAILANQSQAVTTDAFSHTTSYLLDTFGRPTQITTADGAIQTWTLDAAGNPTVYVDQLGRVTSYTYNASEDMTQVAYPDGTFTTYQYDGTWHKVTQIQDALNHFTTSTYDATTSDLLTQKDALVNVTTYTWSNGLMQTMTDPLGRVTSYQWDASTRRQTSQTDPLGNITTYGYDAAGNQISVEDARTNITTSTYDGNRRLISRQNAIGGIMTYVYDGAGNLTSTADELNRTASYTYDIRGLQITKMDAVGTAVQRTTTTTYDVAGRVLSTTDALGDITSFAYDVLDRQIANIDAFGTSLQRATTTAYDAVGNVLTVTDPRGTQTSFSYDTRNRQTQQIDAYGASLQRTTTTAYDAVGNVQKVTNAVGGITSYAYDALYRQTQKFELIVSGTQRTTATSYDAVGNVTAVTNPRGTVTSYSYDALSRRTKEIDDTTIQRTATTVYDAVSNVLSVSNGLGIVTSYSYDAMNRRVAQIDDFNGLKRTTTATYDALSNVVASIDALGFISTFAYDALNRRVTVTDPMLNVATTTYDLDDNVTSRIDQLGHITTYGYDTLNRKVTTTDARSGVVSLSYDANNNLLSLVDPVANHTTWVYDVLNRKTTETDPLSNVSTFVYDLGDRMTSMKDRNSQSMTYSYDLLNREIGETWFNAAGTAVNTLTYSFDANNNLLTSAVGAYINTMTYDALDRVASVSGPFNSLLCFTYDLADNRTLVQDNLGGVKTHVYDSLNRLATMTFGGTGQMPLREDFTYTARDQVATQTRWSNLSATTTVAYSAFTYDSLMRLTNLQHQGPTGSSIANYTNTYDAASRITSEVLNGGSPVTYTYDVTDQLTNDGTNAYSYDLNGNRTMAGYVTGGANELTSDGVWTYTYDKNGNLTSKAKVGETVTYTYDNRNRLVGAQDTTSSLQMQATYVYDASGQRIEKDVWQAATGSVQTTRFSYDRSEIYADLNQNNALSARYLRGDRVLELLAWIPGSGASGLPFQLPCPLGLVHAAPNSPARWVLSDRMGSVRQVVDGGGNLIDTITYDGYGNATETNGVVVPTAYKYVGYRFDGETGFYFGDSFQSSPMNPSVGNWLVRDPMFPESGTNPYPYVGNKPTIEADPIGLEGENWLNAFLSSLLPPGVQQEHAQLDKHEIILKADAIFQYDKRIKEYDADVRLKKLTREDAGVRKNIAYYGLKAEITSIQIRISRLKNQCATMSAISRPLPPPPSDFVGPTRPLPSFDNFLGTPGSLPSDSNTPGPAQPFMGINIPSGKRTVFHILTKDGDGKFTIISSQSGVEFAGGRRADLEVAVRARAEELLSIMQEVEKNPAALGKLFQAEVRVKRRR